MTPQPLPDPAETAISVRGVSKHYRTYKSRSSFIAEALLGRRTAAIKPVLDDINLELRRGEVVGIIGRNGAGKSTLLKLIAGTIQPTAGEIDVKGRVSAILELGTGFNPAYTGRDNVIMSALMRGMSDAEIRTKLESIIAFAGLEDAIDQPFQTYSSGMQARLAFAAAVAVEADVIIIDEALAAGDIRFTARSLRRVREICQSGVTALFVSHQTYHVMQLCTRAVWIDNGRIRMDGPPIEVCRAYEYEMLNAIARDEGRKVVDLSSPAKPAGAGTPDSDRMVRGAAERAAGGSEPRFPMSFPASASDGHATASKVDATGTDAHFSTGQYKIASVEFLDDAGKPARVFKFGTPMRLRVAYERLVPGEPEFSCGLAVGVTSAHEHQAVMYFNTNYPHSDEEIAHYHEAPFRRHRGRAGVIEAHIPFVQLKPGDYIVSLGILPNKPETHEFYEYHHLAYRFGVTANGFSEPSVFYPIVQWTNVPAD